MSHHSHDDKKQKCVLDKAGLANNGSWECWRKISLEFVDVNERYQDLAQSESVDDAKETARVRSQCVKIQKHVVPMNPSDVLALHIELSSQEPNNSKERCIIFYGKGHETEGWTDQRCVDVDVSKDGWWGTL